MSVSTGVQYKIYTSHHAGGYLQFSSGSTRLNATLASDVGEPSQLWTFEQLDDPFGRESVPLYAIKNAQHETYVGPYYPYSESRLPFAQSYSTREEHWYLRPGDDGQHTICTDNTCTYVLAPWKEVSGGPTSANEVVISVIRDVSPGGRMWRIISASSGTVPPAITSPPASPSSSATNEGPGKANKDIQALSRCAPCGKEKCSFEPSGDSAMTTYAVIIGQQVSNCVLGNNETTKSTVGGTFEFENSFAVETTAGVSLGTIGLSISSSTTIKHGTTEKLIKSQQIEVNIPPGQIGALIANISYAQTPGNIKVDDRTLAFVSIEPERVLGYSVSYVPCGTSPDSSSSFAIESLMYDDAYATWGAGDLIEAASYSERYWYFQPVNDTYIICSSSSCANVWSPFQDTSARLGAASQHVLIHDNDLHLKHKHKHNFKLKHNFNHDLNLHFHLHFYFDESNFHGRLVEGDFAALKECAPCGKEKCDFRPSGSSSVAYYSVMIGQSVSNCGAGNNETTKTILGGTFELEQSFSIETTTGVSLGMIGPSVSSSTTISYGTSEKITKSQQIEVSIPPGQRGALVANISYATTPGDIKIDDRTLAFVSISPAQPSPFLNKVPAIFTYPSAILNPAANLNLAAYAVGFEDRAPSDGR
ncbi:hypothetical protein MD484_g6558, partial [Candolleomyces efflorescens]